MIACHLLGMSSMRLIMNFYWSILTPIVEIIPRISRRVGLMLQKPEKQKRQTRKTVKSLHMNMSIVSRKIKPGRTETC